MTALSLKERTEAIRLPVKDLAAQAGLDEMTAHRVLRGKNALVSTVSKIDAALAQEEARLFGYLAELVPARQRAAQ